jgi:hypothetical protein
MAMDGIVWVGGRIMCVADIERSSGKARALFTPGCIIFYCVLLPVHSFAGISEYEDCSVGIDLSSLGENLTASERASLLEQQFETEIADGDRCEVSESGSSGSGSGSGGGNSGGSTNAGGQVSGENKSSSNTNQEATEASPNAITDDQESISVASDLGVSPVASSLASSSATESESGTNGKDHEVLSSANNREALAKNILKRAEEEQDPNVKAALMERYKELSK